MRIRLGILSDDLRYVNRIMEFFNTNYAEQLELFAFSAESALQQHICSNRLDMLLADKALLSGAFRLPASVVLAYFSDSPDVEKIEDTPVVCKYQKADLIYKDVLGIFAEYGKSIEDYRFRSADQKILVCFVGVSGGAGASTAAVACGMHFAGQGKRAVYIDFERAGSAAAMLQAENSQSLSEALYAAKRGHGNLQLKMESILQQDQSGLQFYNPFRSVLDAEEMTADDLQTMIDSIKGTQNAEYLIFDMDAGMGEKNRLLMDQCDLLVLVQNDSEISQKKMQSYLQAFSDLDRSGDADLLIKTAVFYNGFAPGQTPPQPAEEIKVLGSCPRFSGDAAAIARQMAMGSYFSLLEKENEA